ASALRQRLVAFGIAALLAVYALRTVTRIPFWSDSRTVIIDDVLQHPENFRAHARIASILAARGDTTNALGEYLIAEGIFPLDPYVAPYAIPLELARHRINFARADAQRADSLDPF